MARQVNVTLTDLEEIIMESLARRSKTSNQLSEYLEGKGIQIRSSDVASILKQLERLGLVTRVKTARVYRYAVNEAQEEVR